MYKVVYGDNTSDYVVAEDIDEVRKSNQHGHKPIQYHFEVQDVPMKFKLVFVSGKEIEDSELIDSFHSMFDDTIAVGSRLDLSGVIYEITDVTNSSVYMEVV